MANNPHVNKVEYGGQTIVDLTGDTVEPGVLVDGYTAHDRSGAPIAGTFVPVTGVKGNAENSYRTGNVNITPADIGTIGIKSRTFSGTTNAGGGYQLGYMAAPTNFIAAVSDVANITLLYLGNGYVLAVNSSLQILPNTQVSGTYYYHE